MLSVMTAIVGGMLLAACRAPGTAPASRAIEPTVPPVAYTEPTTSTTVPADSLIMSRTSFAEMGLIWKECEVSQEGYTDWRQAEDCFGHVAPEWSDEDEHRSGRRTERGLRVTVGDDVYQVRDRDLNVLRWSTLTRNGETA